MNYLYNILYISSIKGAGPCIDKYTAGDVFILWVAHTSNSDSVAEATGL